MKLFRILFILAIPFMLAGCANEANEPVSITDLANTIEAPEGLVRTYVDNNTFIDVDVPSIVAGLANPAGRSEAVKDDDIAKMKTAIYRFYKNVSLEDGYYVCAINSGKEINISENVFNALHDNLEEMNAFIKAAKDKGETVHIMEPDEAYLNSLLK